MRGSRAMAVKFDDGNTFDVGAAARLLGPCAAGRKAPKAALAEEAAKEALSAEARDSIGYTDEAVGFVADRARNVRDSAVVLGDTANAVLVRAPMHVARGIKRVAYNGPKRL